MKQNLLRSMTGWKQPIACLCLFSLGMALGPALRAQTAAPILSNIWSIAAGTRAYVTTSASGFERGITVNPVSGNVVILSRATTPISIAVVNGQSGADLAVALDTTGIAGGTFALSKIKA